MESHQPTQHVWKEMISIPTGSTWGEHKIHQMEKGAPHGRIGHWQGSTETALKARNGAGTSKKAGIGLKPDSPAGQGHTCQIPQDIPDGYT